MTTNPGTDVSPTLTIMSLFGNPVSGRLKASARTAILLAVRARSGDLSSRVRLRRSALLTPQWLSVEPSPELLIEAGRGSLDPRICPSKPIRLLLDTSLPDLEALKAFFREVIPCALEFPITTADRYFRAFAEADLGVCWFTPDSLDLYNAFTSFDCAPGANCYFNWSDRELQSAVDRLRKSSESGVPNKEAALQVERILLRKGYVAPLSEMNWWIVSRSASDQGGTQMPARPIHPAGLFQVSVRDFL